MKRTLSVLAAVLLLLAGLLFFRSREHDGEAPPEAPVDRPPVAAPEFPEEPAAGEQTAPPLQVADPAPARQPLSPPSGSPVTGRVVRPDGSPVAGATVLLFPEYRSLRRPGVPASRGREVEPLPSVITRADGTFRFPLFEGSLLRRTLPSSGFQVRAERDEEVSLLASVVVGGENGAAGDLVLRPGSTPEIVVETSDGAPVEEAVVRLALWIPLDPKGRRSEQYTCFEDRTDESGHARFPPAVRRGDWDARVEVGPPEHERVERRIPGSELLAGPVRPTLFEGLTVAGRVLLPDGEPAVDHEIQAGVRRPSGRPDLPPAARVTVREDGSFEIAGVARRRGLLAVRADAFDFAHYVDVPEAENGSRVDLGEVRLPEPGVLRGRVLDENGAPVPKVWVFARASGTTDYTGYKGARADEEGRFGITGVPPGTYDLALDLSLPHGDSIRGRVEGVEPDGTEATVRLSRAASILFVFHEKGHPGEPFSVVSAKVDVGSHSWSTGGSIERERVYAPPGTWPVEVEVRDYRKVVVPDVIVPPDRERVFHVELEKVQPAGPR